MLFHLNTLAIVSPGKSGNQEYMAISNTNAITASDNAQTHSRRTTPFPISMIAQG
jgi:hypothetical protein